MNKKIKMPVTKGYAKVPVVMQLEALECGAASLAMVLAYYSKWIPLEQVRFDCGVSRDGSNARNVMKAARNYGLEAKGYRMEPDELRQEGKFPCIIHWNFNHFVVLCGFKGNKAVINDPSKGTCFIPMKLFDESFTGICLMFEPTDAFTPSGKPKSVLAFAKKRLIGAGVAFAFVALTAVLTSLLGVIAPAFSRVFLDRLLTQQNPEWFQPFMILLCVFSAVQILVASINAIYTMRINGKLAIEGTSSFFWKVLHLPMEFFSQRYAGDIRQRMSENAAIASTLIETFAPLVLKAILIVFYFVVMLRYSWILTLIGIASLGLTTLVSNIISKKRVDITRIQMRDSSKLNATTVAGIEMVESIKASGAEKGFIGKWTGYQAGVMDQQIKYTKLDTYLGMIPTFITTVSNLAVLVIGVYLVMKGQFTVGSVMAFQSFLVAFSEPALVMISAGQTIQEMRTSMERVEDVMEFPSPATFAESSLDENVNYDKLSGNIEMKNICFGYSRLAEPLVRDFNLTLTTGKRVAIVGGSGCGKSTIAKLLFGLYKPWSGEILFDGKPMSEIDKNVFTGSVAVVDQDIILFEDTIANNLKMWDSSIEDFEMIMAARDAQIHEDIIQRDGGYQHRLCEGGKDFSGGQRQRMEIARVLAQDPTILIMDEATSALDAKTEYDIVKSIQNRGITCIVIAHRLSTIRDCDEIIVLDHGMVVDRGTHDELMASCETYRNLVTNQ